MLEIKQQQLAHYWVCWRAAPQQADRSGLEDTAACPPVQ